MSTITFQTERQLPTDSDELGRILTQIMSDDASFKQFEDFLFGLQLTIDHKINQDTITLSDFLDITGK